MVEQCNSATEMVEKGDRNGGTEEQRWWNRGASDGGTVEHLMVELSNRDGESVEQRWWNSGTSDAGTVEHPMVYEQWNI